MKQEIISTKNLTKTYAKTDSTAPAVLENVDFAITEGEFTAVMGSSGSGKSTLLYLLAGLDRPTSGEVHFQSNRIDNLNERDLAILRRKGFGFVFQQSQLIPSLTLRDNALIPSYLTGEKPAASAERVDKLFSDFSITGLAGRMPSQVSGGEAQRAAMVRALINCPDIVLADEPTGALNQSSGDSVLDCLSAAHKNGQTIVLVTHDMRAAVRAQRIVFLKDGKISGEYCFEQKPDDLSGREKALFQWLSERGW